MKLKPIKDKKKIATLFEKGRVMRGENTSLRVYKFEDEECGYVVSVPKKNFPLAVDRNLIKRRLRTCLVTQPNPKNSVSVFLIYTATSIVSFEKLNEDLKGLLEKL